MPKRKKFICPHIFVFTIDAHVLLRKLWFAFCIVLHGSEPQQWQKDSDGTFTVFSFIDLKSGKTLEITKTYDDKGKET